LSVNRYKPHVFVLPEDDANSNLANGFLLGADSVAQIQVLRPAGGWNVVLEQFKSNHLKGMELWQERFMVLLIDFDRRRERLDVAKAVVPKHLVDRVFVLGVWSEPEALKESLGSYEQIGMAIAEDCREETDTTWGHILLRHNAGELERLRGHVRSILF
jgi:hypothetical protein